MAKGDMNSKQRKLAPTLWRTCRAMMNPLRLRLLRMVFDHDDAYTVTDFAKALGVEQSTATIYLRQLNARGLVGVRRQRIKVFYNTEPDRSLPEALAIRETMRTLCASPMTDEWVSTLMTVLRAFSHFNRLAMIERLFDGPATVDELSGCMGVCVKSLYHHLRFIHSAGLLSVRTACRQPTVIALREDVHPLAAALLDVLRRERAEGRTYKNRAIREKPDRATRLVLRKVAKAEGNPQTRWRDNAKMKPKRGKLKQVDRKAHLEVDGD